MLQSQIYSQVFHTTAWRKWARFADITATARVRRCHHYLHSFYAVSDILLYSGMATAQTFLRYG
jgi:hypothetical protein